MTHEHNAWHHQSVMELAQQPLALPDNSGIVRRLMWALAAPLLVVTPALDLAWNEPALDESQGARCQLHANPGVALQPVAPVVARASELLFPFEPPDRVPLVGPSIFVPPRA